MKGSIIRDVICPNRAHEWDSGIDFYVPKMNARFLLDLKEKNPTQTYQIDVIGGKKNIVLRGHTNILIPSGIKVDVPKGRTLNFDNKSGVASKLGLTVMAKVIDAGYQGEVHINLVNTGHGMVRIPEDKKIVQGILYLIDNDNFELVDESKLYEAESERGEGGFGHTDND